MTIGDVFKRNGRSLKPQQEHEKDVGEQGYRSQQTEGRDKSQMVFLSVEKTVNQSLLKWNVAGWGVTR